MKLRVKILSFIMALCLSKQLISQRERGINIQIKNNNLMESLNDTRWDLKKIMKKNTGWFVRKKKVKQNERLELFFKSGIVEYLYIKDNKKAFCKYYYVNSNPDAFMHFRINCSDSIAYDWTVYRLSDKKLVAAIARVDLINTENLPKILGRYIFYKKE